MAVLERSELEASPLADLHAIANEVGIDGFRRLRKADLISAILGEPPARAQGRGRPSRGDRARPAHARAVTPRSRRSASAEEADGGTDRGARPGGASRRRNGDAPARGAAARGSRGATRRRRTAARRSTDSPRRPTPAGSVAEGVVEVLGNGSAFLRVDPPEASDEDVYISAAQVRRCELVSGDRVTGPVRTAPALRALPLAGPDRHHQRRTPPTPSPTARATRTFPSHGRASASLLGSEHPTLEAIEWLTPLGRGSRAVIVGARHTGKSETLRRLLEALRRAARSSR